MYAGRGLSIAALMLACTQASAQDTTFPHRREGLWDVATVTERPEKVPKVNMRMCVDRATDAELMTYGLKMSKDTCQRYDVTRKGQTWTIESECKIGSVSSTGRTQISGDFQASVKTRTEGTSVGLPGTNGRQRVVITQMARWVSEACEGMKPGDITLDGGIKINVKQLKQLQKLLPGLIR